MRQNGKFQAIFENHKQLESIYLQLLRARNLPLTFTALSGKP